MNIGGEKLTVFPTGMARRRFERSRVLEAGVLNTSRLTTLKGLTGLCLRAARRDGLLAGRSPGRAEMRLLLEEAAGAARFAPGGPLSRLSLTARTSLLQRALDRFAFVAGEEPALVRWLLAHEPDGKLHGIGRLLDAWRALCTERNIADLFTVNAALLRLAGSGALPRELEHGADFRAVRWLNPFEERWVAALKQRLGSDRVRIVSALPAAHAEAAEDRLGALVRSELTRGAAEEWQPWLEDFADAFEADDGNIAGANARERVAFFVSAHPYGEIEDAARRMLRDLEEGIAPDEIALIVRDLGPYSDMIPDVFQRFGIPYHFRRGTPAAALPQVKILLALLSFPQAYGRDRLCDLLRMPGLEWPGLDPAAREALVQDIQLREQPRLSRLPKELHGLFRPQTPATAAEFAAHAAELVRRHALDLPEEVMDLIAETEQIRSRPMPPERLTALFEELLGQINIKDPLDTESGVQVINPLDAAGLRFESVYIAGMDDRTFPQIPKPDPLLDASGRAALRAFLTERGIPCPRLALPETGAALIQEEILFLTAMSTARRRLTLSYTRTDGAGQEMAPGEFFERLRALAGPERPAHGESFHTILPPKLCRADDEIRQTRAKQALDAGAVPPREPADVAAVAAAIQAWMDTRPEFSATALECLARNRLVFFLEKILGIKPDRLRDDETDPMDRGSILHDILEKVYTAIAQRGGLYAARGPDGWHLAQQGDIPLAVIRPEDENELLALAREIALNEFSRAERRPSRKLGHPAVWETEKRKLLQITENMIRTDLQTAADERRYPALFEMKFDAVHDLPLTLERGGEQIRIKGKIDRIDLIFDTGGRLETLLVADYKGRSRAEPSAVLQKKIERNLDCQIPLYTFAAQQKFFGACNTPELNRKTAAVYHIQERDLKKMAAHFAGKRLSMTPELADRFLETLFENIRLLRAGDLAAEPLIAHYDDYSHICRTVAIPPEDLLKEDPAEEAEE